MLRFIIVMVISLLHIAAWNEMTLGENAAIEERARTEQEHSSFMMAAETERAINELIIETPVYNFNASTNFRCPKCNAIENINVFLNSANNRVLRCQNPRCALMLKRNDINRLFFNLFYEIVSKNLPFAVFEDLYRCYAPEFDCVSHIELMNILLASLAVPLFNQQKLWNTLDLYSKYHEMDKGFLFKKYSEALKLQNEAFVFLSSNYPLEEEIEIYKIKTLICTIDAMWKELGKSKTTTDFINVYETYITKNDLQELQQTLADHFTSYILRLENPFLIMDQIYS
ncbi:hypothetical protein ENBRE01_0485 [Enteropsectra breve]|nr:hypothetical protein ENBRE01_0485 [Enteropsectra breve]